MPITIETGVKKQSKGVHRFMLNLKPENYERVRSSSFESRSSMSVMINSILSEYYATKEGSSAKP